MHITTRPARRADLSNLCAMIKELAAFHGDTATLDHDALNQDIFGAHPWVHVCVAIKDEELVGYVACCPLIKLQYCARGLDLHHIFVANEHRAMGVGRLLIAAAKDQAKALKCEYIMVGTTPDNTAAQAAYLACGFAPVAQSPNRFRMMLS